MEQRKEIINYFVSRGMAINKATEIADVKKSTYYYRSNGRPKGKKPSVSTLRSDKTLVSNEKIIEEIIKLISPEFIDYGYHTVTHLLKRKGYIINHKKVYRLMKENNLILPLLIKPVKVQKLRINNFVPPLVAPFETVEADIKYIYIHEQNKNAFLLTFLCTFCKYTPVWELDYSMKSNQVVDLVNKFINNPIVKTHTHNKLIKIKIRTDNGPQFISKKLIEAFNNIENVEHEFIHPRTPQENAHIESFHNTVEKLVCMKNVFQNLTHAKNIFASFFHTYNNIRVMKSILFYSPSDFLKVWHSGIIGIKRDKKNQEIFYFKEKPDSKIETDYSFEALLGNCKFTNFDNKLFNLL